MERRRLARASPSIWSELRFFGVGSGRLSSMLRDALGWTNGPPGSTQLRLTTTKSAREKRVEPFHHQPSVTRHRAIYLVTSPPLLGEWKGPRASHGQGSRPHHLAFFSPSSLLAPHITSLHHRDLMFRGPAGWRQASIPYPPGWSPYHPRLACQQSAI